MHIVGLGGFKVFKQQSLPTVLYFIPFEMQTQIFAEGIIYIA